MEMAPHPAPGGEKGRPKARTAADYAVDTKGGLRFRKPPFLERKLKEDLEKKIYKQW